MRLKSVPAIILLATSAAAQISTPMREPFGKTEIVALVSCGSASSGLAKEIEQRGINFELDQNFLQVLADTGANDDLVSAVKAAKQVISEPVPANKGAEIAARESLVLQHLVRAKQLNPHGIHYREAEPEYRAAVQADPSNPFTHFALGFGLSRLRRHADAAAEFREATHLRPDWAKAHLSLGKELQSEKLLDEAMVEFEEAMRLWPDNPEPHYALAGALDSRGDKEGAAEQRRIAEGIKPSVHLGGGQVEMAKLIYHPNPKYPAEAKKKQVGGTVRLTIIVGTDGTVKDWEVENGDPLLVDAAVESARQWRYQPCRLDKVPVEVPSEVTVKFQLP